MFQSIFANVRARSPLVHNITNYVTVNDCANMVLACGASPIMADDAAEVEDITSLCAGLNLNIGTLNSRTIPSMLLAGHTAHRLGRPVVLDPVGAGASHLRTETALRLLREVKPTVIRGNISEMRTLAVGSGTTKGVDADVVDDHNAKVDLNVILEYGKSATDVFDQIKDVVGGDLKDMTGLTLVEMTVNVVDVMTPEEFNQKNGSNNDDGQSDSSR